MARFWQRSLLAFFTAGTALLTACQYNPAGDGVFRISTSFAPVYDFTAHIVGDKAEVLNTVGANEVHSFTADKLTFKQRRFVEKSDLIVTLGLNMDAWLNDLAETYNQTAVLENTPELEVKVLAGTKDPHVWLSLKRAAKMVAYLAEEIAKADADNAAYYQTNAAEYLTELRRLDQRFTAVFDGVSQKAFVTSHEAYGYLAADYGLTQFGIASVNNGEASAKRLNEAIDFVIAHDIKVIYVEELAETAQADTVIDGVKKKQPARQVAIKTLPAYESIATEDYERGHTYLPAMQKLLDTMQADMASPTIKEG